MSSVPDYDAMPPSQNPEQGENPSGKRRTIIWMCIISVVVTVTMVAIIALVVVISFHKMVAREEDNKLECVASRNDKDVCVKAGCIWEESSDPDTPSCLLPKDNTFGFHVDCIDKQTASLRVENGSFFGDDFKNAQVQVIELSENIVRIKFLDKGSPRYEVPIEIIDEDGDLSEDSLAYDVELVTDPKKMFQFKITRKSDKTVIFDTSVGSLFLSERHIEVTTKLPSRNVYGIGESPHKTFRHDLTKFNKWPLFSRDQPPNPWDGAGRYNLYGVHPYYMCLEDSGKSHGVLFLNSNAMEFTLTPMPALNFRSSGGILDIIFFVGDSPEHVTQLYTGVIGRPIIPPYWSLGFQLSRYGYNSLDKMRDAINRTTYYGFPLDVFYADIDVMNERRDFTWDNDSFPNFDQFVKNAKANGLRFIPIIDPGIIANDSTYTIYKDGEDKNIYVTWPDNIKEADRHNPPFPGINTNKSIMFGWVWPKGPVAFPDFFKNATNDWWGKAIEGFRQKVDFDGLWIDMNEPCNFGTNQEEPFFCPSEEKKCWALKCPENKYDDPNTFDIAATTVYTPRVRLSDKTLCMVGVQGDEGKYVHYDVHSLYGLSETKSTYSALVKTAKEGQVPYILSRSTYPSSGRYGSHWLGDNISTWKSLQSSIIGILEFNLFGIPHIGADICGFADNSTSELCGRWMQLGAFYPFSRNHNYKDSIDQDPGSDLLKDQDRTRALTAMHTRYQLLPYLHTLHYFAHTAGNTVARALFHEFPKDTTTRGIQEQFMWGSSLLISPVIFEGATSLNLYLPNEVWYDFYTGMTVKPDEDGFLTEHNVERVALHVRGGSIIPLKENGSMNTDQSREKNFEIHVYPKENRAFGDLYWTAKQAKDLDDPSSFRLYHFQLEQNRLWISSNFTNTSFPEANKQIIGKVVLYGLQEKPSNVYCLEQALNSSEFDYNSTSQVMTISHEIDLGEMVQVSCVWN